MKLKYIEVYNYTRINRGEGKLNHFKYTPDKDIQVVLGTNGCGKSSFLELLTGYPVDMSDIGDNGFIQLCLIKDGVTFYLRYGKEPKVCYNFSYGDISHDSINASMYKQLLAEHLGITKEVHDILTNASLFTNMSIAKRREMFMNFSRSDYTYVLGVYKRLRASYNATCSVIKHSDKRIMEEYNLIDNNDVEAVRTEMQVLKGKIEVLEGNLMHIDSNYKDHKAIISNLHSEYRTQIKRWTRLRGLLNKGIIKNELGAFDSDYINELYNEVVTDVKIKEVVVSNCYSRLSKLNQRKDKQDVNSLPTLEVLLSKHTELRSKLVDVETKELHSLLQGERNDVHNAIGIFDAAMDDISMIQTEYNYSKVYYAEDVEALERKYQVASKDIVNGERFIERLRGKNIEMNHLKDVGANECPRCEHKWYTKYDEAEHNQVKEKLNRSMLLLKSREKEYDTLVNEYKQAKTNVTLYHRIKNRISTVPLLRDVWIGIIKLMEKGDNIGYFVSVVNGELNEMRNQLNVRREIDIITDQIKLREEVDIQGVDTLDKEIRELEKEVEAHDKELDKLLVRKKNLHVLDGIQREMNVTKERIISISSVFKENSSKLRKVVVENAIKTSLNSYRERLTHLNNKRTRHKLRHKMIEKLETELKGLQEEKKLKKILLDEMSPKAGLIATSMLDFVNSFLSDMNKHIESIWTYPLEMIMPTVDGDSIDIDFNFKLWVDNKERKKGSSSVQEIVNLAFKLTMMEVLDMSEYPLMLDELGRSFDEQHRSKSYEYIKEHLANSDYSNVWVINHYPELYSIFNAVDTSYFVLNDRNINLSAINGDINEELTIF